MSIQDYFDNLPTYVKIFNGTGNTAKKQRLYFGCNYENIPTVIIKWCETGRGFGEYVFQLKEDQMICDSEGDNKETVKRILNIMVDNCKFVDERDEKLMNIPDDIVKGFPEVRRIADEAIEQFETSGIEDIYTPDLRVIDVVFCFHEDGDHEWLITIEEAAPDAHKLQSYIEKYLMEKNIVAKVITEW